MTENDYIAEYIKEEYPNLLGVDFALWKMGRIAVDIGRKIVKAFNNEDWSKYSKYTLQNEEESEVQK